MFHPMRVAQWLEARNDWNKAKDLYPLYIEVSPMGACSHRCVFCAMEFVEYPDTKIDPAVYADRIAEMGALGVKAAMMAGEGEPLLQKRMNEMVDATTRAGVDISFTTNGVLLDKLDLAGVSWVKVSINAGTLDTYTKVHRTNAKDWDRVWANLRDAVKRKGTCTVGVQMVMLPENEHEAQELQDRCDEVGVDYLVLKPYSQHKMSERTKQYEGFKPISFPKAGKRLIVRDEAMATEKHPYEKCSATPNFWAFWASSGDLYSCSAYLLNDRFNLGNLNSSSFKDVWQGERRKRNWEFVTKELNISECRVNCRMQRSNEYLAQFGNLPHANFI